MGKKTKIALAVAAASAAAWAGTKAMAKPQPRDGKAVLQHNRPVVFAHRGGAHLAPENTLQAFEKAVSYGVDGLDLDVRLTKDEEILVFHDASVDRTTDGVGLIADLTVDQIKALNHGYNFEDLDGNHTYREEQVDAITLREVFEKFPDLLLSIDIKDAPDTYEGSLIPSKLWRLIEEFDALDRVIVTSFYNEQIERFNLYAQDKVALGSSEGEVRKAVTAYTSQFGHLYNPAADVFQVPAKSGLIPLDSPKFIQFLQGLNVPVHFSDVNDLVTINRLIRLGAKGIVTDRPDIAQVLFDKYKEK